MRNLLIVVLLGVAGYLGYEKWWASPPPPVEVAPVVEVEPVPPVDFAIKMRVKRILDEWKRQALVTGAKDKRASMVEIKDEIKDIQRRLYDEGLHDAMSLKNTMKRAAVELGYAPDQAEQLVNQVLGGR